MPICVQVKSDKAYTPVFRWSHSRTGYKGSTTTAAAAKVPYTVKVTATALNVRKGPGTNYAVTMTIRDKGVYTIVEEKNGWGRLKSGAGWISLAYTEKRP